MAKKNKKGINAKNVLAMSGTMSSRRQVVKVGRNQLCPCGSERKYKDCHQAEGQEFLEKLAKQRDREAKLQQQREEGAPWYRRLVARLRS